MILDRFLNLHLASYFSSRLSYGYFVCAFAIHYKFGRILYFMLPMHSIICSEQLSPISNWQRPNEKLLTQPNRCRVRGVLHVARGVREPLEKNEQKSAWAPRTWGFKSRKKYSYGRVKMLLLSTVAGTFPSLEFQEAALFLLGVNLSFTRKHFTTYFIR